MGNEYTAFGTAVHSYCEQALLREVKDPNKLFTDEFVKGLEKLIVDGVELDQKLVSQMEPQGEGILPEVLQTEESLYENMEGTDYKFKGFIDLVVKTPDGKIHIIDWKTCSWGWNRQRRSEPMTTYQLTLYKNFYAKKHGIDPSKIETHFALLKRTAKKGSKVEIFRVTSGPRKTSSAMALLNKAIQNIENKTSIKNRLSCKYCAFYKTEHCK
jgi:RecB family exonuclease